MSLKVEMYEEHKHYNIAVQWWKEWKWDVLPPDFLPAIGSVATYEDKPVSMAWLYKTDSKWCLMEFFISDKSAKKEIRSDAIDLNIKHLLYVAKKLGFEAVHSMVQVKRLIKRLEDAGFASEGNVTTLATRL